MNSAQRVDARLTAEDAALLAQQHSAIDAFFDQHIPTDRPVAVLQFPWDANVGNHMMWLAISEHLHRRGVQIAYAAHQYNFRLNDLMRAVGDGPILFLGGVTVSRLWPSHSQVKRSVAAACPGNRLISLPSTMIFVDEDDRREAGEMFGDHRDVVMMARDPLSAQFAREVFPAAVTVAAVHDSAFRLSPQPLRGSHIHDIIWLARDDKEATGVRAPSDVHVFDWVDVRRADHFVADRVYSRLRRTAPVLSPIANALIGGCYTEMSRYLLHRSNRKLDTGKVLVTDRMHPHVLAALRSQPCVLLPDRYGKNRAVFEYSSRNYSSVHWADTPQEALEVARQLVRDPAGRPLGAANARGERGADKLGGATPEIRLNRLG